MEQRGAVEEMERRRPTAPHQHQPYTQHTQHSSCIPWGSWNLEPFCALDLNRILAVIEGSEITCVNGSLV